MKEGWIYKSLGEVGNFFRGGNFTKSDFIAEGTPCMHYGQIHMHLGIATYTPLSYLPVGFSKLKFAQKGDLIIAITSEDDEGSCKSTAWMGDNDIAVGGHIAVYRHQLNPIYVSYYFHSPQFNKAKLNYTHGFKVVEIKPSDIAKIQIPVPPLSEQEKIVSFLDAEFAKIDALKANTEQQLQAAKDLFQSALKQVFVTKENWKYLPLGEVTSSINGLWKGKKPPFVNVGVIRNANFTKDFTLNLSNIEYLDVEERQYSTRKLQRGDLIVEKSGGSEKQPVGRTILFDLEGEYSVSNFTSILRIKDRTLILPTFLYKYLLYIYKEGYTKEMQNATTGIHNIIYDKFLSIPVPILSLPEQERIAARLDSISEKVKALQANYDQTINLCNDLKQSLLKSIFA